MIDESCWKSLPTIDFINMKLCTNCAKLITEDEYKTSLKTHKDDVDKITKEKEEIENATEKFRHSSLTKIEKDIHKYAAHFSIRNRSKVMRAKRKKTLLKTVKITLTNVFYFDEKNNGFDVEFSILNTTSVYKFHNHNGKIFLSDVIE